MELINDRYRIIKNLYQNQIISSYIANDLFKENRRIELNIFNYDNISENLMSFFASEYLALTSINSCRITKLHQFGVIDSYDGKQLNVKKYFYIRESMEGYTSIQDYTEEIEKDKIIDVFIKICQAVSYLHIRGFVHGEINLSNIYIRKEHGEYDVKLKDFATIELEKHMYWLKKRTQFQFKAPEILYGNKPTILSDIYSLGVLLTILNYVPEVTDTNFRQILTNIRNDNDKLFVHNSYNKSSLIGIIRKMTNQYPQKRYSSVREVVEEINKSLNTEYKPFIREELNGIVRKTKIIGRDREITKIIHTCEMIEKGKSQGNIIFVHGEHGIGKTRFFKELRHIFLLRKMDIYHTINGRNSISNSNRPVAELIKQLMAKCDPDIVEHYGEELVRLIPGLDSESALSTHLYFNSEKEKFYVYNRILSFMKECTKTKPAAFILDNVHLFNDEILELMEYLINNSQNQRVIIIIGYCDKNDEYSNKIYNIMERIKRDKKVQDIALGSLNIEETAMMIKNILGLPNIPMKLATRIYTETYGNPLFIEEVIKNLCAQKLLFINDDDGNWNVEIDDYDKIPIPSSIYQAVLNQIKNLDKISTDILKIMSIFITSVSANVISEMLSINEKLAEDKLEAMVDRGILDKKVEDWGYTYDLHNIGVKTFIYNELNLLERKEKHRNAALYLERLYAKEGRENKEELIYHLEKADEREKAIEYCCETATAMYNHQFRNEAIKKLEKALSLFEENSKSERKLDILLKIGDIYNETGNNIKAIEYYDEAYRIAVSALNYKNCIDALNRIADIYVKKNDIDKGTEYNSLSMNYLKDVEYEEGYLTAQLTLTRIYFNKQRFEDAIRICNENIEKCHGKYIELEAKFYNEIGITYLEQSLPDDAYTMFSRSIKLFESINNPRGIALLLNNIGVISGDFHQDVEESINIYNRMKDICEKHNIIDLQITAESNLAECYYDMEDFDKSLKYHLSSLELSKRIGYEAQIFNAYVNLCKVSLKLYEYENAYEYFINASNELEKYPVQRKGFMGEYYRIAGELYYAFGCLKEAEYYALKAYDIYENDEFICKWNTQVLLEFINIQKGNGKYSIIKSIEKIRDVNSKYVLGMQKIDNLYRIGRTALEIGELELACELIEEANKLSEKVDSNRIKLKTIYLNAYFEKSVLKIKYLEEALELAKKEDLKIGQICIYNALGDYYFLQKEYYSAIKYYFESCEITKKLAMQIPGKYRLNFIKKIDYLYSFKRLIEINRIYNDKPDSYNLDDIISNNLTIESLKDLFEYKDLFGILTNKQFVKVAEKDYILPKDIKDINDVINNLSGDSIRDMDLIVKFAAKLTLATRSYIILVNENQEISVAASKDNDFEIPNIKFIIEKVNSTKEPLFIVQRSCEGIWDEVGILPFGIKAVICIPILKTIEEELLSNSRERRKVSPRSEQVTGYLYIDSERIFNNFNHKSFKQCCELKNLVQILIDNYKLRIISSIDKLTGVFTRKYLEDALKEELNRSRENNKEFSLIMFDIDKFKNINDKFGHQKGDKVLKEICSIVRKNIRKEDVCGRYGGEEFIIILPGVALKNAQNIAEKLRDKVEKAKILGDKYPVTMSLGVASYPIHGDMEQELIEKIDQALYVAKELGRNRSQAWNSSISGKGKRKDRLAGIVSGNMVQDNRNVLAMVEIIELIKEDINKEDKIYKLLGRIIEISEAQKGMLFIVSNGKIVNKYGREKFEENWVEVKKYNSEVLNDVIREKQGVYRVDWDDVSEFDSLTGVPDWQSIIVTPLIKSQEVKGVLYLSVSARVKEFDFNHFNFISILGDITASIL